jgi:hypothetical protein
MKNIFCRALLGIVVLQLIVNYLFTKLTEYWIMLNNIKGDEEKSR